MASIVQNTSRGTWCVQYHDGKKWRRVVVVRRRQGWKPGDSMPKKPPAEVNAALVEYEKLEKQSKGRQRLDSSTTVAEFLDGHLAKCGERVAEGTKEQITGAIKVFVAWCDGEKLKRLDMVTSATCHRWMDHRAATISKRTGKPIAFATLKRERALLASAWSDALRREDVDQNPWLSVEVPGKQIKKTKGSWSPEQVEKLMSASKPWLRDLLTLGIYTGLRIKALRNIRWDDIQWSREGEPGWGIVVVRPELDKAKKGYKVPIGRKLHDMLARKFLYRESHAELIISGDRGEPIKFTSVTHRAIRSACQRADLPKPISPNHHLRRTFGRWAVLGHLTGKPIPMYVVSRWLGHSSLTMTMDYLDMTEDESRQWMDDGE